MKYTQLFDLLAEGYISRQTVILSYTERDDAKKFIDKICVL